MRNADSAAIHFNDFLFMTATDLTALYRDYIACLNEQDWSRLGRFVHEDVTHNDAPLGLMGYRRMLEKDFSEIPDLFFNVELIVAEPPRLASRLRFHCTPKACFLGLPVNGKKVSFTENVFYEFLDEKIVRVWSVIDRAAIEAQLTHQVDSDDSPRDH
jgi:predicted ester cyclase